ncbi:MAG: hypothetical protein AB1679_06095 [Actinomycetota bacterium]|jgi:hypothetical protein
MAIDERARHQLYLRLEEHLGPEAASTLMEHLPPTGWGDVARKRDLDQFAAATQRDLDHLEVVLRGEIDRSANQLRAELHKAINTSTVLIVFTAIVSNVAAVFTVSQLR